MDLKSLYQDIIVDHNRSPRNFRRIEDATRRIDGYNPLCGDRITLYVKLSGDVIEDVSFEGSGCAISTASASLMTEALKGLRVEEAEQMFQSMHDLLTQDDSGVDPESLGKLAALEGVRDYPSRVKCATLCWHTLRSALQGGEEVARTE